LVVILAIAFAAFALLSWIAVAAAEPNEIDWVIPIIINVGAILMVPIAILTIISKVNGAKARKEWLASAYPRWKRGRDLWDDLYYCSQNDIVFLPGRLNAYAPASEMDEFLAAQASQ
jgi:hypothetical protein